MTDTTEDKLAGSRVVVAALRDLLSEERARSEKYRDALVRIRSVLMHDADNVAESIDTATAALEAR